ncbi:MAG TPA: SRPBCC family protein [Acidimicrobiales bacterium]
MPDDAPDVRPAHDRDDLGRLDRHDGRWRLRFVRRLPHPPAKVFRALTEREHLAAWFPTDVIGDREAGAKLRFVFRDDEAPPIDGEMVAYDPPRLVEYRWGDEETLRFELAPDDGGRGTVLTFANGFDELGKAARDAAGWHACLDLLAVHLDGAEPPWSPRDRWGDVHPRYVAALGPEAAAIGPPDGMAP